MHMSPEAIANSRAHSRKEGYDPWSILIIFWTLVGAFLYAWWLIQNCGFSGRC